MPTFARALNLACAAVLFALPLRPAPAQNAPEAIPQTSLSTLDAPHKSLYSDGITAHWYTSAAASDFPLLQTAVDAVVASDGHLLAPPAAALPLGSAILLAYRVTRKDRFYRAALILRQSPDVTHSSGDTTVAPFLADFAATFHDRSAADTAAALLLTLDSTGRTLATGLLSRSTEASMLVDNIRFAKDLLDTIDFLPIGYPQRRDLIEALNKSISALTAEESVRHSWESPNSPATPTLLLAYTLARGVRLGLLAGSYTAVAEKAWSIAAGKPRSKEDSGAYLLAKSEADQLATQPLGQGKTVMMDAWFNAQTRPNAAGGRELFHYKWSDEANTGFSFMGHALQRYGLELDELRAAPTKANLDPAQIYFIVSPDTPAGNPAPHFMDAKSADAIEAWVKGGGVLVLMMNNSANTDFEHTNLLAERFGMHFSPADRRRVEDSSFEQGTIPIPASSGLVQHDHRAFMKDLCTLTLRGAAHPAAKDGNQVVLAVAAAGRGIVLAVTDPWLYNEYTDGRKLPASFDNFAAAVDLTQWLLKQTQ